MGKLSKQARRRKDTAKRARCRDKKKFPECKGKNKTCIGCKCKEDHPDCTLYSYKPTCCERGQQAHHVIPVRCFMPPGERKARSGLRYEGCEGYDDNAAPCICVSKGQHEMLHDKFDKTEDDNLISGDNPGPRQAGAWTYKDAREAGIQSVVDTFKPKCSEGCMRAQLDAYHKRGQPNMDDDTYLKADSTGGGGDAPLIVTETKQISSLSAGLK